MKKSFFLLMVSLLGAISAQALKIEVGNPLPVSRKSMVETDVRPLLARLGSKAVKVTDPNGREIPSQITSDSLLIFQAYLAPGATAVYTVDSVAVAPEYPNLVYGKVYPERADDIAWENETAGYRVYGPATQAKGERGFGYDIFLKHRTPDIIVPDLYASQCSPRNWHIVDSLKRIDPKLASDFEATFTYHRDHGKGMDCYAVGPTLGAGVAAPLVNDSLSFAWCYKDVEITDNGPLRYSMKLTFAPRKVGGDTAVVEHRIITLDAGSPLNHNVVIYENMQPKPVATGFARHDESPSFMSEEGILAYKDPTQGEHNGHPYLGIVAAKPFSVTRESEGHILGITPPVTVYKEGIEYLKKHGIKDRDHYPTLDYYWGQIWDMNDPVINLDRWVAELQRFKKELDSPLTVKILD